MKLSLHLSRPLLALVVSVPFVALAAPATHADEGAAMTVYKTPWCGCCEVWTDAMRAAGYKFTVKDMEDLTPIKKQAGVSSDLEGCHTAVMGTYVLEGHVPLEAIGKLRAEQPDVRGIAVPGMPAGSLGMGQDPSARYTVYAFGGVEDQPVAFYQAGE